MSLADIISSWDNTFSERNKRPHIEELARANAAIQFAEANNAPQYFRGRSQEMENQAGLRGVELQNAPQYYRGRAQNEQNQAGLTGLQLQYAPERFNMERQNNSIGNDLNRLKMEQIRNEISSNGGFKPNSPFGKLQQDYGSVVKMYGENSPQAQEFKQMIQKQIKGSNGMTIFDPRTGQPLVNMGGSSNGRSSGGGTLVNPLTGEITSPLTAASRTRDQKVIAGSENLQSYIGGVADKLPQFQSRPKKILTGIQGLLNENVPFLGANFEGPSTLAEGNADLLASVEGFMNNFNLTSTDKNAAMAKEIFAPQPGESAQFYKKRVERQAKHLLEVDRRARERQITGNLVGHTEDSIQKKRESLEKIAKYSIDKGADPAQVNAEIQKLLGK